MVRSLAVDFVFFIVFMMCQDTKAPNRVPKMVPRKDKLQKYPLQITKAFKFELTNSQGMDIISSTILSASNANRFEF